MDLARIPESGLDRFNPDRFDAMPNGDGTYRLTPVRWWDDASYTAYQGDDLIKPDQSCPPGDPGDLQRGD